MKHCMHTAVVRLVVISLILHALVLGGVVAQAPAGAEFSKAETVFSKQFDTLESLAAADVDGNGLQDIIVGLGWGSVYWFANPGGDSADTPWPVHQIYEGTGKITSVAPADMSRDGLVDILVSSPDEDSLCWFINGGKSEEWTKAPLLESGGRTNASSAADINGDGLPDAVVALKGANTIVWFENHGNPAHEPRSHLIAKLNGEVDTLVTADIDGDDDIDVSAGLGDKNRIVWIENKDGKGNTWTVHLIDETHAMGPVSLAVGDVDGDDAVDVLAALYTADKVVWYANRLKEKKPWEQHVIASGDESGGPKHIVAADLDSDGYLDVLAANWLTDSVWWYENLTGQGTEWEPHLFFDGGSQGANSVTVADFDGDGDPDPVSIHAWPWAFSPLHLYRNTTPHANLQLAATATPQPVVAGGQHRLTYAITVTNQGPSESDETELRGRPPVDLQHPEFSLDGGAVWNPWNGPVELGRIRKGAKKSLQIRGQVAPSAAGFVRADLRAVGLETFDPRISDGFSVVQTQVIRKADILVKKKTAQEKAVAGSEMTYEIEVANLGPSDADDVRLEDRLTSEFRKPEYSEDGGKTWRPWSGSSTLPLIPALKSRTLLIRALVAPSARGNIAGTAQARGRSKDPDPSNNSSGRLVTPLTASADVALISAGKPAAAIAGRDLEFALQVENRGPSDADEVSLDFTFAGELSGSEFSLNEGKSWEPWNDSILLGNMEPGQSKRISFRSVVSPSALEGVYSQGRVNTATEDPTRDNNHLPVQVPVNAEADLGLQLEMTPGVIVAGRQLEYDLAVGNAGPSNARGVRVLGRFPDSALDPVYSLDHGNSWEPWPMQGALGDLKPGETRRLLVRSRVSPSALGQFQSTVSVTSETDDPLAANNESSVKAETKNVSVLDWSVVADTDPVIAGTPLTYTVHAVNKGPSDARNAVLESSLPGSLKSAQYSLDGGVTWTPWKKAVGLGTLPVGTKMTLIIRGTVLSSESEPIDARFGLTSDSAASVAKEQGVVALRTKVDRDADISLRSSGLPQRVISGESFEYLLSVINEGPSDARDVSLQLEISSDLKALEYWDAESGAWMAWTGPLSLGTVQAGVTESFKVRCPLSSNAGVIPAYRIRAVAHTKDTDVDNNIAGPLSLPVGRLADLTVTLSDAPDPVTAGEELSLVAAVVNAGPSDASAVEMKAEIPSQIPDPVYSLDEGKTWKPWEGTASFDALTAHSKKEVRIRGTVDPGTTGLILNTAKVFSKVDDPNEGNNRAGLERTVVESKADLRASQSALSDSAVAGNEFAWDLTAYNDGPSDATEVWVQAAMPEGIRNPLVSMDDGLTWNPVNDERIRVDRIAAKDEKRILFRGLIEPSRRDPLVGKVVIGSETPEVNEENDAAIMEIGVVETADLRIGIESVKETNIAGNEISYRIILENTGPSNAANVTLRDNTPERLSRPEISVDGGSTWLPWPGMWNFDVIPSGEVRELLLQGRIDPAASGLLTYEARIDSSGTPDPDKHNDRFAVGTEIVARADLSLELLHAPDAVLAGDETEYRLRVSNLGPSDAMGVGLSYEPLGLLERAKASVDGGDNWEPSSGTLELGSLDAGGVREIVIRGRVPSRTKDELSGAFLVSAATSDSIASNDKVDFSSIPVSVEADVSVLLWTPTAPFVAGERASYTITVSNNGPSDADEVLLNARWPETVRQVQYSPDQGKTWRKWEGAVSLGNVRADALVKIPAWGILDGTVVEDVAQSVEVISKTRDPILENNHAHGATRVVAKADLSVIATVDSGGIPAGKDLEAVIKVTNAGPSSAPGVVLIHHPEDEGEELQVSKDGGTTWTALVGELELGDMAPAETLSLLMRSPVPSSASGKALRRFEVASSIEDTNPENNLYLIQAPIVSKSQIALELVEAPESGVAGRPAEFLVRIGNSGPSDAGGVVLNTNAGTALQGARYRLPEGNWEPLDKKINIPNLPVGGIVDLKIEGRVPPDSVGSVSLELKPSSENEGMELSGNDLVMSTGPLARLADLSLTRTDGPTSAVAGLTLQYEFTVLNSGPSHASGVVVMTPVSDRIPQMEISTDGGDTWQGFDDSASLGELSVLQSRKFLVRSAVDSSADQTLDYRVRVESQVPDPREDNNLWEGKIDVSIRADLAASISQDQERAVAGSSVVYRMRIENLGPSDARNCIVEEDSASEISTTEFALGDGETWRPFQERPNLGTVRAGEARWIRFRCPIPSSRKTGFEKAYTVRADTDDPDSKNSTARIRTDLESVADLSVQMEGSREPAAAGDIFEYLISIVNQGPSDALGVTLTDELAHIFRKPEIVLSGTDKWISFPGRAELGTIPAGKSLEFRLRGLIDPSASGTVTNTVNVGAETRDTNSSNNSSALVRTTIERSSDMAVLKVGGTDPLVPGEEFEFVLEAKNLGPSDADKVRIGCELPSQMKNALISLDNGGTWMDPGAPGFLGGIAVGEKREFRIRGLVDASTQLPMAFNVTVASDNPDPVSRNNSLSLVPAVHAEADLSILVTADHDPVVAGGTVVFRVMVKNEGPSDAGNVAIKDAEVAPLSSAEFSSDGGDTWSPWKGSTRMDLLPAKAATEILVRGVVSAGAISRISRKMSVSSAAADGNPKNDTMELVSRVATEADLSAEETTHPNPITAGTFLLRRLRVVNHGASDARGVVIRDRSAGLLSAPLCRIGHDGRWEPWNGALEIGTLEAGQTRDIEVRGVVPAGRLEELKSGIRVESTTSDPNPGNNDSRERLTQVKAVSDLSIHPADMAPQATAGEMVEFAFEIRNNGPSDARDVVAEDEFPEGRVKDPEFSLDGGENWSPWKGSARIRFVKAGEGVRVKIRGKVDASAPQGAIPYTVAVTSATEEARAQDNSSGIMAVKVNTEADLSIKITGKPDPVEVTRTLEYDLIVKNLGPSDARDAVILDDLPSAFQDPEFKVGKESDWRRWAGSMKLGTIPAGSSTAVRLRATVSPAATLSLKNRVEVRSTTIDPNIRNNRAEAATRVETIADLGVTMTGAPDPVRSGDRITYTVVIYNHGPCVAEELFLKHESSPSLVDPKYSTDGGANWRPMDRGAALGRIEVGQSRYALIQAVLDPKATGRIESRSEISSATRDIRPENNLSDPVVLNIVSEADLQLTKSASVREVAAGESVLYTISVENRGPSDALQVKLTDRLPPRLLQPEASLDGGASWNRISGSMSLGTILSGTTKLVLIRGKVSPDSPSGSIINTAVVESDTLDPNPENSRSRAVSIAVMGTLPQ